MRTIGSIYGFTPQLPSYKGSPDIPSTGLTYTVPLPNPAVPFLQISQSKDLPASPR